MLLKKVGLLVVGGAFILGGMASCGNAGGGNASAPKPSLDGKALFEKHCAVCHKDGGNIINPRKTLKSSDLAANGIKKPEDVVRMMREPGPGMTRFDKATIPDDEARAIAGYVISAF